MRRIADFLALLLGAGKPLRKSREKNLVLSRQVEKASAELAAYKYALDESAIVAITDHKGIITYVNDNFCSISGYSRTELIGKDHRIVNSGYHTKEFIRDIWRTIASGRTWKGEIRNRAKNGEIYWVDTTIVPFPGPDNKPIKYIAIRFDITPRKTTEQLLEKSLKELSDYKYALDASSIVAKTDEKGKIIFVNDQFCAISGFSKSELMGQDHRIINSGYHPRTFFTDLWSTISAGKIWKGEIRNRAKAGHIYWVDTTIVPFLDPHGKPFQYVAIRSDITGKKLSQENEKQLEEKIVRKGKELSEVLARITDGFLILDENFRYTYANKRIGEMTGKEPASLLGKNIWEEFPDAIGSPTYHSFLKAMKEKTFQFSIDHFEPLNLWQENYIYPSFYGVSAFIRDVSHQKKHEEQILKSERLYRSIASNIPGTVISIINKDRTYLLVEGVLLEKLGYTRDQLVNHKAEEAIPVDRMALIRPYLDAAFEGSANTFETSQNGFDILYRFVPFRDEKDSVFAVMIVGIDITDQKNAQRKTEQLNAELELKVEQRTLQLQTANKDLEAFSYSVAHDLRAPLRAISGYAAMLREDHSSELKGEAPRYIAQLEYNSVRMSRLIDDLLAFSRLGRKEVRKGDIDMNLLMKEVIPELELNATQMACITTHELPASFGDFTLIKQVFVNLLSNAIKYTSKTEHPTVEIGALTESSPTEEKNTIYWVRDNGAGFDMAQYARLFGVFQRLHHTSDFEGTGVGLAIVQRIVQRHHGKVWAESEPGKGAIFFISLPKRTENE